jgi:hypothetical protein
MIDATANTPVLFDGQWVYYTGDAANHDGFARVSRVHPPSRFDQRGSVDLRFRDGREFRGLTPESFNRSSPGCRFVDMGEWRASRRAAILEMRRGLLRARA